jgi:hypothetical protein
MMMAPRPMLSRERKIVDAHQASLQTLKAKHLRSKELTDTREGDDSNGAGLGKHISLVGSKWWRSFLLCLYESRPPCNYTAPTVLSTENAIYKSRKPMRFEAWVILNLKKTKS